MTKQDGSGLGLAVFYSIIQKHSGHINVESEQDMSTTFHIYLPASPEEYINDPERISTAFTPDQTRKILVTDDEEMVCNLLETMLSALGHTVICCQEGSEGLQIFEEELHKDSPVDLIIMDLTIPGGLGGKETAQKILQLESKAKIVVASSYTTIMTQASVMITRFT